MTWPWLAVAGLGVFHGLNPAMGWLFAVALGLHRRSRLAVVASLVPIAAGHALAVALVAVAVVGLGLVVDARAIRLAAGAALIAWAVYHQVWGRRHRTRVGMRAGMGGLALWSFAMASAHGAGLMLAPILPDVGPSGHAHGAAAGVSLAASLGAVAVHTLAMLLTTAVIALVVHEWVGLAFLRRGWVNLDRLWTAALAATGVLLILLAPRPH